jgi:hypothetical protein
MKETAAVGANKEKEKDRDPKRRRGDEEGMLTRRGREKEREKEGGETERREGGRSKVVIRLGAADDTQTKKNKINEGGGEGVEGKRDEKKKQNRNK